MLRSPTLLLALSLLVACEPDEAPSTGAPSTLAGAPTDDGAAAPAVCASVQTLRCGDVVRADTSAWNDGATDLIDHYPVAVGNYSGPEIAYAVVAAPGTLVELRLVDPRPTEVDHDLVLLGGECSPDQALARGFHDLEYVADGGLRHLVVDGFAGDAGAFELAVSCEAPPSEFGCDGDRVDAETEQTLLELADPTTLTDRHDARSRIDAIADRLQACGDPRGLFATVYRPVTHRAVAAIDDGEYADNDWSDALLVDFFARYLQALHDELSGVEPAFAWERYYALAERDDVAPERVAVVGMLAHLALDLPHSLVAVETSEDHRDDFFDAGALLAEVSDAIVEGLRTHHDADAEAVLRGFFLGQWADGWMGAGATTQLGFQAVRTKAWNNRWLLQQGLGPVADAEISASFWTADAALAALDAAGVWADED